MEFNKLKGYVEKNQDEIRSEYGSEYIAVCDSKVIDHDVDEFLLAERVEKNYKGKQVLIGTLETILNPLMDCLESPEVEE